MSPYIKFINHASILIKFQNIGLLSDPWYFGDVFHKGWNLLYENKNDDIIKTLDSVSHLWISHEHPDHFSIPFYLKYKNEIKTRKIKILFQKTTDKRVVNFLKNLGLEVIELKSNSSFSLAQRFKIKIIKSEFYDSALIIDLNGTRIFNLNDCPIDSIEKISKFKEKHGHCDVLLTQFSYAAWKGGIDNKKWRDNAANEKLNIITNQVEILKPKIVIPFASMMWFSNEMNYYLNDSSNKPSDIHDYLNKLNITTKCTFLKPYQSLKIDGKYNYSTSGISFWDDRYEEISKMKKLTFTNQIKLNDLEANFNLYCKRVYKNNSHTLIKIASYIPFLKVFNKLKLHLIDYDKCISIDLSNCEFKILKENSEKNNCEISLYSESLDFIFKNTFGFDTLTVNGCFEETRKGGFSKVAKTFSIENLNNLGIKFNIFIIFNFNLIKIFILRLIKVNKKLSY